MATITLKLPYPPSANNYHGAAYRKALEQVKLPVGLSNPLKGNLSLSVKLSPPAGTQRRDIDNPLKALLDGLTHAKVWEDDSQVRELHVAFTEGQFGGFAAVAVRNL